MSSRINETQRALIRPIGFGGTEEMVPIVEVHPPEGKAIKLEEKLPMVVQSDELEYEKPVYDCSMTFQEAPKRENKRFEPSQKISRWLWFLGFCCLILLIGILLGIFLYSWINKNESQCPKDWIHFGKTDSCYYLQNFTYPDSAHWQGYNWTTAEANCQQMGAHLVSIHSKEEDDFLLDLILSYVGNITDVGYDIHACHRQWVWVGYSGNGTVGTGTWTDGSPVDYIRHEPITSPEYWMLCNDPPCECFGWHSNPITTPFGRYLCKMPSKSRLFQEVENNKP